MLDVITILEFTAFIPIAVYLVKKPRLNSFFKLLLASIFLSIFFDTLNTILAHLYRNNILTICTYNILNAILITYMWQKVTIYSTKTKQLVRNIGIVTIAIMALFFFYFKLTINSLYLLICLNVLLGFIFALQYYYQKITLSSYSPLSNDPYFITATAYILMCLSTIIITAAQIYLSDQGNLYSTWVVRQGFYLMYNIIIAYAFYVLYKSQLIKK